MSYWQTIGGSLLFVVLGYLADEIVWGLSMGGFSLMVGLLAYPPHLRNVKPPPRPGAK